jgi:hypothetical protein
MAVAVVSLTLASVEESSSLGISVVEEKAQGPFGRRQ